MGVFSKLIKTAIHTTGLAVGATVDAVTCGMTMMIDGETLTEKSYKKLKRSVSELSDEVDDL